MITWPENYQCALAISWDIDAESGLKYRYPDGVDDMAAVLSQLQFGPLVGVPNIVKLLKKYNLQQTFFMPGWVMEHYPETVELLMSSDQEIGLHGYLHERLNDYDKKEEEAIIDRSLAAYYSAVGELPVGWRSPGFSSSRHTSQFLFDKGITYDSSLMGDDYPYLMGTDDAHLMQFPVNWALDDWPYYMHSREFGVLSPIHAPGRMMEVFWSELEAAYANGGLVTTIWHPFLSGRASRLVAIEAMLEKVLE